MAEPFTPRELLELAIAADKRPTEAGRPFFERLLATLERLEKPREDGRACRRCGCVVAARDHVCAADIQRAMHRIEKPPRLIAPSPSLLVCRRCRRTLSPGVQHFCSPCPMRASGSDSPPVPSADKDPGRLIRDGGGF